MALWAEVLERFMEKDGVPEEEREERRSAMGHAVMCELLFVLPKEGEGDGEARG